MVRFSLLVSVVLLATACLVPSPADDDDDDATVSPTESPSPTNEPRRYYEFGTNNSQNDRVTVVYEGVSPPPTASVYVAFLVDDAGTGFLNVGNHDAPDDLFLVLYSSPTDEDLLATYSQALVTVEDAASADTLTAPTGSTVFSGALTGDILTYGRELLVSWPGHPDGTTSCAHGWDVVAQAAEDHVHEADDELQLNMDLNATRDRAELVYNIQQGLYERFDVDGDLTIEVSVDDDGFGILSNTNGMDSQAGYINSCSAIIGQAIANEPEDSPIRAIFADLDQCMFDMRGSTRSASIAALALASAPDVAFAIDIMNTVHFETDDARGDGAICFLDWGYEMMRIPLE